MTYWKLKGRELVNCNCDYGCNCQFGGLPDKGRCQAVFGMAIDAPTATPTSRALISPRCSLGPARFTKATGHAPRS
jgi:Protein of unknown function (DUF1326)